MLKYTNIHHTTAKIPDTQALFTLPDGKTLTRVFFVKCIRNVLHRLGYDQMKFCGHSFRSGGATSASAAHVEDHLIKTLGRWSSDCYTRYIKTPLSAIKNAQQALTLRSN